MAEILRQRGYSEALIKFICNLRFWKTNPKDLDSAVSKLDPKLPTAEVHRRLTTGMGKGKQHVSANAGKDGLRGGGVSLSPKRGRRKYW